MLGLGLGLGKGGFLRSAAAALYASYVNRVKGFGGTLYNAACLLNKITALNTGNYLKNLSGILIFSGVREDSIMGQTPSNGDLDPSFTRGSTATYTDSLGNNRTSPDSLLTQSIWSGVGTNVAPSGWTLYTGAGSSTATIEAAGSIYNNNRMRCFSTTGGRRYITQNRTYYQYETYTISVYVDSVTVAMPIMEILNAAGPFLINTSYKEDGVIVSGGNNIVAGKRYSYTFTTNTPATGTLAIRFGGGSNAASSSIYDFVISRPMVVFGADEIEYTTTTDRQNFPRITFDNPNGSLSTCGRHLAEPSRTNGIRNNWMIGAVVGTPGTLPTNWSNSLGGLTQSVVGVGIEKGFQYIDLSFTGTASATSLFVYFEANSTISATFGQDWASSIYAKVISSASPPNSYNLYFQEKFGGTTLNASTQVISPTSTLARYTQLYNLIDLGSDSVRPSFYAVLTIGLSYNFTIRIASPQCELGKYPTSTIRSFTAATTRAVEASAKGDIYATNIISSAGGIMFLDMKNTIAYVRANTNPAWYLSTDQFGVTGNGLVISNSTTALTRPQIGKYVSGVYTQLYQLLSDNNKILFRWNGTVVDVFVNGSKVVTGSSFTAVAMNWFGYDTVPYTVYTEEIDFSNTPSLWPDAACISRTT